MSLELDEDDREMILALLSQARFKANESFERAKERGDGAMMLLYAATRSRCHHLHIELSKGECALVW